MSRKSLFTLVFILMVGMGSRCLAGIVDAGSWGYQLQNADPVEVAASKYDVIVMDYSRDGTDAGAYSHSEIQLIKDSGKTVLAYFSIGEAEDYRFYWKKGWKPGNPAWLGPENPQWAGNYKVRYWKKGWWTAALRPYLNRILAAGFDGVYMDIIDAYWFWHIKLHRSVKTTASDMVDLVGRIARYSRTASPGFIFCPQNGESIIDDAQSTAVENRYFGFINAIGVEDLFYHYGSRADRSYRLKMLRKYATAGKKVFNIEYIGPSRWDQYMKRVCALSFDMIPYGGDPNRELDELIDFPDKFCPGKK
jgi:cysteinyl-tRNA synthetase, unknown class